MDFRTAILNAKTGNADSFEYLRQSTTIDMYYLALKYVNDDSAAREIIDKTYLRAEKNISDLSSPDDFKSWLGRIVIVTSLEYMKTKKPLIFSAVGGDENNGMSFIYETQDNDQPFTPDRQYSQDDIRFLSKELLNSLSDEQRMCIVMHHIDGQIIADISECLDCSQNTVISRLYYGRNKLRDKIDYLRTKGFYINTDAPIPLLKYILNAEKTLPEIQNYAANKSKNRPVDHKKEEVQSNVQPSEPVEQRRPPEQPAFVEQYSPVQQGSYNNTTEYTSVRPGILVFLSTITGKITALMLIAVSIGAVVAGIVVGKSGLNNLLGIEESSSSDKFKTSYHNRKPTDTETESENNTKNIEINSWKSVSEDQFPELISGHLNKSQLELVLARLPKDYNYINSFDYDNEKYIHCFCDDIRNRGSEKGFTPPSGNYNDPDFRVDELNRIFSSFGTYEIDESNFKLGEYISADPSDIIVFDPDENSEQVNAVIISAQYDMKSMNITFINEYYGSDINKVIERKAELKLDDSGCYRIRTIKTTNDNVDKENSLVPKGESSEPNMKDVVSETSSISNEDDDSKSSSAASSSSQVSSVLSTSSDESFSNTSSNEIDYGENENNDNSSYYSNENSQSENNPSPNENESSNPVEKTIDDYYNEKIHQYRDSSEYARYDIDDDGIEDLIIRPVNNESNKVEFFTCTPNGSEYRCDKFGEIIISSDVQLRFEKSNRGLILIETPTESEDKESYYILMRSGFSINKHQTEEYAPGEPLEWTPCM